MEINYVFHIGERCNSLEYFKSNNLLSGMNCFSGTYTSFNSVIDIISNNFNNIENNIVRFKICDLGNKDNEGIVFARCYDYTDEQKEHITKLIKNSKWDFFFKENYYTNANFCVNLQYTDEENLKENDLYFYKNKFCIFPNADYVDADLERLERRTNRFKKCLTDMASSSILLIYMDKLTLDTDIDVKMNEVIEIYKLPYNLFYIIPIYSHINNLSNEKIITVNNITFSVIYFPSLDIQKRDHPNDDNCLCYNTEYSKIKDTLLQSYDLKIVKLFE